MTAINTTADSTTLTADFTRLTADYDPYALPYRGETRTTAFYLGKITPWQAKSTKPKFRATVAGAVQPYVEAQALLASLPALFDLDLAVGAQLDVVGQWIGRSRFVSVPIPGAFFSFGVEGLGWNQAYWKGPYDGADGLTQLPDDLYRRLLYAKVASNSWDGTIDGAEAVLRTYFNDPAISIFINDDARAVAPPTYFAFGVAGAGWGEGVWKQANGDPYQPDRMMLRYTVCVAGRLPSAIDLHILGNGLIPVKAGGVKLDYAVTSVDGAPLFGFGMDDANVSGFGKGAWGVSPATAADLSL